MSGHSPRWSTFTDQPTVTDGADIAEFAARYLIAPHGFAAGSPITLSPWQRYAVDNLYARRNDGRLALRRALIGVGRKNGKSILGAVLVLYELATNPLPVEIYSAAGSTRQAGIVMEEAKRILRASPVLRREAGLREYQYRIQAPSGALYQTVSADAALQQGLNPSLVIFDEVHVQPNAELWDAMTLAGGARPNSLVVGITTAGYDLASLCGRLFTAGVNIADGSAPPEPAYGFAWWSATDDDADPADHDAWDQANPNLGADLMDPDEMGLAARQTPRHVFQRYRLNLWTSPDAAWVNPAWWMRAQVAAGELVHATDGVYVGVRFGLSYRDAAVVVVSQTADHYTISGRVFLAPADGEVVDFGAVRAYLADLHAAHRIRSFAFDPRNAEPIAAVVQSWAVQVVEWPSTLPRLVPATGDLYRLFADQAVTVSDDPTLRAQVLTAVPRVVDDGFALVEPQSGKSISAARALVIAAAEALHPAPSPQIW